MIRNLNFECLGHNFNLVLAYIWQIFMINNEIIVVTYSSSNGMYSFLLYRVTLSESAPQGISECEVEIESDYPI